MSPKFWPPLRADSPEWMMKIADEVFVREQDRLGDFVHVPAALCIRTIPVWAGNISRADQQIIEAWLKRLKHDPEDVMSVQLMKTVRAGYAYEIELLKIRHGKPYKVTHVVGADGMFPDMVPHR